MIIFVYDEHFGQFGGEFSSIYEGLDYYAKELDTTIDKINLFGIECNKEELPQVLSNLKTDPLFYGKTIYSLEYGIDTYVDEIIQIDMSRLPGGKISALKQALRHNPDIIVLQNQ